MGALQPAGPTIGAEVGALQPAGSTIGAEARLAHCGSVKAAGATLLDDSAPRPAGLRGWLRELYHGQSRAAVRFRVAVIVLDLAVIGFFVAAPILRNRSGFLTLDYAIAALLALELLARGLAYPGFTGWFRHPSVWLDAFVLATLLAPHWGYNLGYLRMLRLWSVVHSEFFWTTIGRRYDDTRWEDVTKTVATLFTFLFVTAGVVYTGFAGRAEGIRSYVDALYFTVTSVTTTGYGDVLLPGHSGRLLSILIMISGITLFVRLAQALFQPNKVRFRCPTCGLLRHDPDAVHCKACGTVLNIPDEGE
ncbi:MAG: potassium channel family protein [Chloroflexi bacterium]|nr:potassium channel family protein [Chloroflexota bacterium]